LIYSNQQKTKNIFNTLKNL